MASCCQRAALMLTRLLAEQEGQGLTEYALILTLIALVAFIAVNFLGLKVTSELSTVANSV
jgi:Flp pilus assembly pilin Flp